MENLSKFEAGDNHEGVPISFESEGQKVAGSLFSPEKSNAKNPGVLIMHGWQGNRASYVEVAEKFAAMGLSCLSFDFRGHGESAGDIDILSRKNFLNDAIAAYDTLSRVENVDLANISAIGASFGAYMAAILSEKRPLRSLAFRVPADYPDEGFDQPGIMPSGQAALTEWRSHVRNYEGSEALRGIHQFKGDLLIIESEKDAMVPHETIQSYMDAAPERKRVSHILMKDAPHSLGKLPKLKAEYEQDMLKWFSERYKTE